MVIEALSKSSSQDKSVETGSDQTVMLIQQLNKLRKVYPELVFFTNENEDNWYCDICLDMDQGPGSSDEPLAICELCLLVVHPSCYRRDLYKSDPYDESPWYCERCLHVIQEHAELELQAQQSSSLEQRKTRVTHLPTCMLCPDK